MSRTTTKTSWRSPLVGLDEYQELAQETAIYPRVYTEVQVGNMMRRLIGREFDNNDDWRWLDEPRAEFDGRTTIEMYLDEFETPWTRLVYPLMGLAGEVGEMLNKAKKCARDGSGEMDHHQVEDTEKELGDVAGLRR
jgi:hypothetical protein